jgi:hypothetical protein
MSRAAWVALLLALAFPASPAQAGESACARFYRDFFDRAGQEHGRGLEASGLAALEEMAQARPDRCGPGDYRFFIGRYADLVTVLGADGFLDPERHLLSIGLTLAPRRVSATLYEPAFQAFLDVRTRLAAHLPSPSATEGLALFDQARPLDQLPSRDLAPDRDGMLAGLTEVRRLLALGEVAAADARVQEMLRTLQAQPTERTDAGAIAP